MKISVAFDVKNHVELMEDWPITIGNETFSLKREGNVLKSVCLTFSDVDLKYAPVFTPSITEHDNSSIEIRSGDFPELARKRMLNWQAIVCGLQIIDLDYDNFELSYQPENIEEEPQIPLKSIKTNTSNSLGSNCTFEQLGRAFCSEIIPDDRIESTAHYREGIIAFGAKRYVDAYNNMFLLLESRYCDGKTGTPHQVKRLESNKTFCDILERTYNDISGQSPRPEKGSFDILRPEDSTSVKIKKLVELRGKLRHHSIKSPHRWDPNKQDQYRGAAHFLALIVGRIVQMESMDCIYSTTASEKFREAGVNNGFETTVQVETFRLDSEINLALLMKYPTNFVSTTLCLKTLRRALKICDEKGQLADTIKLEATESKTNLSLFSLELGIWVYTDKRAIELEKIIENVEVAFEHLRDGTVFRSEFTIAINVSKIDILDTWNLLLKSFEHIERVDPKAKIMSLKVYLKEQNWRLGTYRVGASVMK